MDVALPRVHDAPGEQERVRLCGAGEGRPQRSQRELRQAEALRDEAEALREPHGPREREQQPVPRQHDDVTEPLGDDDARGRVARSGARQRLACSLHEVTERHSRRARDLAAAALHAGLHRAPERVVERRAVELDRAHGGDPPARRRRLETGDAVGRTVRQAEPARDARDQLVLVDREQVPAELPG